jgi:hypothetical protein
MAVGTSPSPVPAQSSQPVRRRVRIAGYVVGIVLAALVVVLLSMPRHHRATAAPATIPASWARPAVTPAQLAQRSGVQVTEVAVSGDGGLIDLRYRVMDPDAAAALHDPSTPPAVVDERTGLVVHTLLMNHAHVGAFKAGVTYYLVFDNPGNLLQSGQRVSVLLGNARLEHVVLQ